MKYILLIFFGCLLFSNCNNENKNTEQLNKDVKHKKDSTIADVSNCYRRIIGRDSFMARLKQSGNDVSGRLVFDNYEKDGSSGDVHGKIEGDIIKLLYTFNSEGMKSVMEIYFKTIDNKLIRGIGTMETRGDTAYFKDPALVNFPEQEIWQKISCDEIAN